MYLTFRGVYTSVGDMGMWGHGEFPFIFAVISLAFMLLLRALLHFILLVSLGHAELLGWVSSLVCIRYLSWYFNYWYTWCLIFFWWVIKSYIKRHDGDISIYKEGYQNVMPSGACAYFFCLCKIQKGHICAANEYLTPTLQISWKVEPKFLKDISLP